MTAKGPEIPAKKRKLELAGSDFDGLSEKCSKLQKLGGEIQNVDNRGLDDLKVVQQVLQDIHAAQNDIQQAKSILKTHQEGPVKESEAIDRLDSASERLDKVHEYLMVAFQYEEHDFDLVYHRSQWGSTQFPLDKFPDVVLSRILDNLSTKDKGILRRVSRSLAERIVELDISMRTWKVKISGNENLPEVRQVLENARNKNIMQLKHFKIILDVFGNSRKDRKEKDLYEYSDYEDSDNESSDNEYSDNESSDNEDSENFDAKAFVELTKAFKNHIFELTLDLGEPFYDNQVEEIKLPNLEYIDLSFRYRYGVELFYSDLAQNHASCLKALTVHRKVVDMFSDVAIKASALKTLNFYRPLSRGQSALPLFNYGRNVTKLNIGTLNLSEFNRKSLTFPNLKHLEIGTSWSFGILEPNKETLETLVILSGGKYDWHINTNISLPVCLPNLKTLFFRNTQPVLMNQVMNHMVTVKHSLKNLIFDTKNHATEFDSVEDLQLVNFVSTNSTLWCQEMLTANASTLQGTMQYLSHIESVLDTFISSLSNLLHLKQLIVVYTEEDGSRSEIKGRPSLARIATKFPDLHIILKSEDGWLFDWYLPSMISPTFSDPKWRKYAAYSDWP